MTNDFQISTLDLLPASPALAISEGISFEAPYLYVTPHNEYVIAKIDTRTFSVVDTLDLRKVGPGLSGMLGSFAAGGCLYILPHLSANGPLYQRNVVKVDLANFTPAGCTTLPVLDASKTVSGSGGLTDGVNGYINVHVREGFAVTRFGLGANFNAASVSTVAIAATDGLVVLRGELVALDKSAAYVIATVVTKAKTETSFREMNLYLVTIPTAKFTAEAAKFQRLTNVNWSAGSVPQAYTAADDGTNLWLFPMPILNGPMAGTFIEVMKIPKADPAAATAYKSPATQLHPPLPAIAGTSFYDGWRYCYYTAQTAPQILQLDTHNPGTVNLIDIAPFSKSYAMYGLGYDGRWGYAVSFNGAAGLCLRFLPTQPPKG